MKLLRKFKSYYRVAYLTGHFPSLFQLLFTNKMIFAYYGFLGDKNFGDELVYESAKQLFKPNILVPFRKRMPIFIKFFCKNFKPRISGIIIGGGTLFGRLVEQDFFLSLAKQHKPIYIHGTGASQKIGDIDEWKKILNGCFFGGIRGPLSKISMEKIGFKMEILGDAAFAMLNNKTFHEKKKYSKNVLVNMGTHIKYGESNISRNEMRKFIKKIIEEGFHVQFLPFHSIDVKIGLELKSFFPGIELLEIPKNYSEGIEHFYRCIYAIGERLHFNIMAILAECPFLSINYDKKHEDFLSSVNLNEAGINMSEVCFDKILTAFENREAFNWKAISQKLLYFKNMQYLQCAEFIKQINRMRIDLISITNYFLQPSSK